MILLKMKMDLFDGLWESFFLKSRNIKAHRFSIKVPKTKCEFFGSSVLFLFLPTKCGEGGDPGVRTILYIFRAAKFLKRILSLIFKENFLKFV
jgi:hypothetical protein